jgi:hypothetical protein
MKRDTDTMIGICEAVASGTLVLSTAAQMNGISARTFWRWMQLSNQGDENYLINWPNDDEPTFFHRALAMARRMFKLDARGLIEQRLISGFAEPVFFQGRPSWVEMEEAVGLDEDTRELLGYPRDGLLRDEFGRRVQHKIIHAAPVQLQIKFLESQFPDEYTPTMNQNINQTINGTLGVVPAKPRSREDGPPPVPPPPPRPLLEAPVSIPTANTDTELAELLGDEPNPMEATLTEPTKDEPNEVAIAPTPSAPEPRVIKEPNPAAYQPTAPDGNMSPLRADLISRLIDPAKRSANPIGSTKAFPTLGAAND